MGVSGCMNDCAETCIKDIGLVGKPKGWTIKVGGNGGGKARLSEPLVEGIATNEDALAIIDKIVNWFKEQGKVGRLGKIIEDTGGIDNFKEAILK
jgi:NAD(P)H-nitrite reductase large subunit